MLTMEQAPAVAQLPAHAPKSGDEHASMRSEHMKNLVRLADRFTAQLGPTHPVTKSAISLLHLALQTWDHYARCCYTSTPVEYRSAVTHFTVGLGVTPVEEEFRAVALQVQYKVNAITFAEQRKR